MYFVVTSTAAHMATFWELENGVPSSGHFSAICWKMVEATTQIYNDYDVNGAP